MHINSMCYSLIVLYNRVLIKVRISVLEKKFSSRLGGFSGFFVQVAWSAFSAEKSVGTKISIWG